MLDILVTHSRIDRSFAATRFGSAAGQMSMEAVIGKYACTRSTATIVVRSGGDRVDASAGGHAQAFNSMFGQKTP